MAEGSTGRDTIGEAQRSFGKVAEAYVTSGVHANGPDLAWMVEEAAPTGTELVVDVATGAGHTALRLAPHVAEVAAVDVTLPMLEAARQLAASRQVANIRFLEGSAQSLPFADGSVDIVTCRYAAHHFPDVAQAVHEWFRVLKPGGKLLLVDTIAPEEPELDAFLNKIEVLRDPSHVRDYRLSEWLSFFQGAGFSAHMSHTWGTTLDVPSWTKRMNTPTEQVQTILQLLQSALDVAREQFHIRQNEAAELSFAIPTVMIVGRKPQ